TMALPIWALFYQKCYADKTLDVSKEEFEKPEDISIELDCEKYLEDNENPLDDNEDDIEF
ncbi:MAG: hypothetical protein KUG51_03390, partial [Urechidicola sp.]|nr:hypothetical protein [Urechidicola sp.]